MKIKKQTLEKLRDLINEETEYRSGPKIVKFFNELGSKDTYGQGFPSRWRFTDEKLQTINGTPNIDQCIKNLFDPINFIDNSEKLDLHISEFNKYLAFDKWKVVRNNDEIAFQKSDKVEFATPKKSNDDSGFLSQEFNNLNLSNLPLEHSIIPVLEDRIQEIEKCFSAGAYLAVIFLAGSTLEGLLLGIAIKYPQAFNCAKSAPHTNNKVKVFHEWSLASLINVSTEINLLNQDTKAFSHALRDFRNYIHPFNQMSHQFTPTNHTAKMCLQALKGAIHQINENIKHVRA